MPIKDEWVEKAVAAMVKAYATAPDDAPAQATLARAALTDVEADIRADERGRLAMEVDQAAENARNRGATDFAQAHSETADWLRAQGGK